MGEKSVAVKSAPPTQCVKRQRRPAQSMTNGPSATVYPTSIGHVIMKLLAFVQALATCRMMRELNVVVLKLWWQRCDSHLACIVSSKRI